MTHIENLITKPNQSKPVQRGCSNAENHDLHIFIPNTKTQQQQR